MRSGLVLRNKKRLGSKGMEAYLPIAYLNDFIFCPRSIYFHQLYGRTEQRLYQSTDQTKGKAAHQAVDRRTYSTSKHIFQGMEVYSHTYQLGGKVDVFDSKKGELVERKKRIKVIYDGYIFQLYAQYFCLIDMGYQVKTMKLYSMDDNKNYPIDLPENNTDMKQSFVQLLEKMRLFCLEAPFSANPKKCMRCIYRELCDEALC